MSTTAPANTTPPSGSASGSGSTPAKSAIRKYGWLIVIVLLVLFVVLPLISSYNTLIAKRNGVQKQFAAVEVQLQRRYDLIPNLVEATKATLGQEQAVYGQIAEARTRYAGAKSDNEKIAASNDMQSALARLMVIVENYPQLQSNTTVQNLMTELTGTENRISQERRLFNESATDYNTAIQTFPRNIFAGIFGFEKYKLVEAPAEARTAPKVDLGVRPTTTSSAAAASTSTTVAK